jgi:C4-dicarboxylate transporter, DctM subunit
VALPLVTGIGYDGVWLGVFVTVMCTIGLITPPSSVADLVLVGLLIAFPALTLWLPGVLRV